MDCDDDEEEDEDLGDFAQRSIQVKSDAAFGNIPVVLKCCV